MVTWSYGERFCLLCERPAYPTDYYPPDFIKTNKHLVVPLCQYHKATYMSHGLKKMDEIYRTGKLEWVEESECISKTLMKECGCYPKNKEA